MGQKHDGDGRALLVAGDGVEVLAGVSVGKRLQGEGCGVG
jgi:hypothetical protein